MDNANGHLSGRPGLFSCGKGANISGCFPEPTSFLPRDVNREEPNERKPNEPISVLTAQKLY